MSYTVWRWCGLLQVSEAAIFVADKSPPQQRFRTWWAFTLYWQEVGGLWLKEMFGEADHMTAHVAEWVETAELLWHLEENTLICLSAHPHYKSCVVTRLQNSPTKESHLNQTFTKEALEYLLLRWQIHLLWLFCSHTSKSNWNVHWRLQTGLEVHLKFLFQPTGC